MQTSIIGDITQYKNFDLYVEGETDEFFEFAIKSLEDRGFKKVEHNAAEISFVCFLHSEGKV